MLLLRLRLTLVFVLSLFTAASLAQTTINVGPGQPYTTIQSAINAANNGDTVLVAPGTYTENINFNGKAITVTSSGGPAITTISGSKQAATVAFVNGESRASVLSNFTITGGGDGSTIAAQAGAQGGITILLASPTITGNIITGAGCFGIGSQAGAPLVEYNTVSYTHENTYTNSCGDGDGSGIWLTGLSNPYGNFPLPPQQPPQILHNVIEFNTEAAARGNSDAPGGAGIAVRAGTTPFIAYNTIRHNAIAQPSMYGGSGGGILVFGAGATIVNNLIYGNMAVTGGGGVSIGNFAAPGPTVTLINNTIADNSTLPNGGIFIGGEQLYFAGSSPVNLQNNLVVGASTRPTMVCFELPSIYDPTAPLPVIFGNNDIFNGGGPATGGFNGSSCDYPSNANGNQSADPLFLNEVTADYHLTRPSPAIDAGSDAALTGQNLTTDLDNTPRIQDATGHGCIIDIGAYEYPGSKSLCGTNITLASSLNPSPFGQTVTFTAQLTSTGGVPTGSVQFSDGATVLGAATVSAGGAATFATGQLTVGSHTITAAFQPTGNFPAVTATLTQVVNGYPTTTQLTSSLNPAAFAQSVTFTAAVVSPNGTPGGAVTFLDGATILATVPVTSGAATYSTSALAVGSHGISATLSPSGAYAGSSATLTETIVGQPSSTSLGVTPNPATAFSTLRLTSTVTSSSGAPTGTITFTANGIRLGSAALDGSGTASVSVTAPAPGTYSITAVYSGDTAHSASTSATVIENITAAPSATTLTASPNPAYQNQPVTLSAVVTGVSGQTPTGVVTFFDGSAVLGTAALTASGTVSLSISTFTPGTHTLTVVYGADSVYAASASTPVAEVILPATFAIVLSPSSVTLAPAKGATVGVALNSIGGFSGPLRLSLGAMPTYTNATISPGTVTLTAGGTGAANLLLNASAARLEPSPSSGAGRSAIVFATLLVLLLPLRRKGRAPLRHLLGMLVLAALLTGVTGCGVIGFPFHASTPGTYAVPVTATDSKGNTQTAILTLTIAQ